jgi:dTDP-glucose 4,6-dehydratase
MRILITGGAGFLGHHLVQHFLKTTEADIVVLDKLTYASAGLDRLRDIGAYADPRVRVIGCDLSQPIPEGVAREVGELDYVIHAAAETHVDNSIADPMPFLMSNVIGTHHLLWWLAGKAAPIAKMPKRVFVVSTDEVYGPATWDSPGNTEIDPFRPANPYSAAKAGEEAVAMAYANTYKLPITIVNTMNLYGERQSTPDRQEKFIPLVIRRVLLGEKIFIHADPTRTRSGTRFYLHCRNYASALAFLMRWDTSGPVPLKLHVSGEREISNLELAQTIADVIGKPLHSELVDFHSDRPGHDLRYALDDTGIRRMGWQPPVDIESSLRKTIGWYIANPRWLGL